MTHELGKDGWPSDLTVIRSRDSEIEELRAEVGQQSAAIEILRAALQRIADTDCGEDDHQYIAKDALDAASSKS
jgi:hypothetical protein